VRIICRQIIKKLCFIKNGFGYCMVFLDTSSSGKKGKIKDFYESEFLKMVRMVNLEMKGRESM